MKCNAKLRGRGQVTIPKETIEALNLKTGDLLILDVSKVKE